VECNRAEVDDGRAYLRGTVFGDPSGPHHAVALAIVAQTEHVSASDRLSPQQDRTWSLFVGVMMWLRAELDAYLEQVADLSHTEFGVLRCLALGEDRAIHMSRLAATASVTPSHLSRIVGRLEKRELLARSADPTDARKTLARLTPAGDQLLADVEPGYVAEVRSRVFDLLGDRQLDQLEHLAEAIPTPLRGRMRRPIATSVGPLSCRAKSSQ
jgi:DNA-binding MarR family transcriptional regulator